MRLQLILGAEPITPPTYQTAGNVLRERFAIFLAGVVERGVSVSDSGGWDEDGGAGREFDDYLPIPKDQVAALRVVVVAERMDGAHPENDVVIVAVKPGANVPPEIEGDGGKDAEGEGAKKRW